MRAIVLLLLTACGSKAPTVDLPPQWDAMESAVGAGKVENADETELHVTYTDPPGDLLDQWKAAAEAGGWKLDEPRGLPGLIAFGMSKGDEKLDLLVSQRGSRADVLVTK